jgi:acyl carrier protein
LETSLRELTEADIYATIAASCGLKLTECHAAANLNDLGIDSLGMAALIAHCEIHFAVEFDDATIAKLMSVQTVGQIAELVKIQSLAHAHPPRHA